MLGGDVRRHRAEFSGLTVCYQDISGVRAGEVRSGGRSGRGVDLGDLTMENSSDNQGGWREDGPAEPPADLLRRALSHVEDLLGRLEYPAVKQGELQPLVDERADLQIDSRPVKPASIAVVHPPTAVDGSVDADPLVRQARETALRIREEAHATADAIVLQARRDAQLILEEARAEADELTRAAAGEAEQTLADAETKAAARFMAARR